MSYDVYLQAFKNRKEAGIPRDTIRELFSGRLREPEENYWQAHYNDFEFCDLFLTPLDGTPHLIHNISVGRPCRDIRLWNALFSLLAQPGTIFYFPGGESPVTRDPSGAEAIPKEMIEALGEPVLVATVTDLLRSIDHS